MEIIESKYNHIDHPKEYLEIGDKPGLGWSAPIALPMPIRVFGKVCTHITLSEYGAIRFLVPKENGRKQFLYGDKNLPEGIDKVDDGFMLVPWGELQRLRGCGNSTKLYQVGSVIVIDFETKRDYGEQITFQYQIQFDVRQPNIITVHYHSCVSGFNTFIGLVENPDTFVLFDKILPHASVALRFDSRLDMAGVEDEEEAPVAPPADGLPTFPTESDYDLNTVIDEPATPPGQFPTAIPERLVVPDVTGEWEPALDDKYEYRIQRRLK